MIIPTHGIGVERQVGDMGNAGVTGNLLGSFRRGTDRAGKQRACQDARSALQAQRHGVASRSARRAASTWRQAASGMTPQMGQG